MTSEPASNIESFEAFLGNKLLEYVDSKEFFSLLIKRGINEKDIGNNSISELYLQIPKDIFNSVFFDCVMFNYLKNIFIYDVSVDKVNFKAEIIDILKDINESSNIPSILKTYLRDKGFNLMPLLGNQSNLGDKFVIALEYVEQGELDQARLLFSHVVPTKSGKVIHNVCGVIVDFLHQRCTISFKNITDLDKGDTPAMAEKMKITLPSYREWIMKKFSSVITFKEHDVENVRLKMYEICKKFDDILLKEDRALVNEKLEARISRSINKYVFALSTDTIKVSDSDKTSLINSILSLMNGIYVKAKYKSKDLQKKAKYLKLDGYPTKIQYTSSKFDKGATQSSCKSEPVASSEIYHSIYSNFSEASSLEKWSIAWFSDYQHTTPNDYDVIQTTIYVRLKMTHVIFLPTRALNEEIINHVIGKISNGIGH